MTAPNKVYSRSMVPIYTRANDTNMLFRYKGPQRSGRYLDDSGNGNSSATRANVSSSGLRGISLSSNQGTVTSPILGSALNALSASHSMGALIRVPVPAATQSPIFGKGVSGAWSFFPSGGVSLRNTGVLALTWYDGGADYTYTNYSPVAFSQMLHTLYVMDYSNSIGYLYVNGLQKGSNAIVITAAAAYLTEPYRLGLSGSSNVNPQPGSMIKDCTLWSRALSAADVRKEWLQYAQMAQFKTGWGSKVSVANESTVGAFVGQGSSPWEILSGTWKISTQTVDGELHKVLECVAAGTCWLDRRFMAINNVEAAYGSWRFFVYHATSGTPTTVGLTATAKATPSVTTGYYLRVYDLQTRNGYYNAGAFTDFETWSTGGGVTVPLELQVRRSSSNLWQHHLRRIGYDWSNTGTDTEATYTTSEGMSFTANAGDWISLGTVRDGFALTKFFGEFAPTEV